MPPELEEIRRARAEADCLVDAAAVEATLVRLAEQLTTRLAESNPLVYVVMNGGVVFAGQLVPRLAFPLELSYLHATRYRNTTQGGELGWKVRPGEDLKGRTVLVLDDVLDEGHTLAAILAYLCAQGAAEVLSAVLVHKVHTRKAVPEMRADFTGLDVEDRYLFGCGMDYKGYWRNLPGVYAVKGL